VDRRRMSRIKHRIRRIRKRLNRRRRRMSTMCSCGSGFAYAFEALLLRLDDGTRRRQGTPLNPVLFKRVIY
jgi:hypothetical protein